MEAINDTMGRILLVEDDPRYRRLVRSTLQMEGYKVNEVARGRMLTERLQDYEPDVIVLDLRLPDQDGITLCQDIRRFSIAPILVLTAVADESSLVAAVDAGADAYIVKPFSLAELNAHVRAMIRRNRWQNGAMHELSCGDVQLDTQVRHLVVRGQGYRLTSIEWRLMREFVMHCGQVLPREYLLSRVWGSKHSEDHEYLRVYIRRLRTYLEPDPQHPVYLVSHVGVGYALHGRPQALRQR